ncbi:TetR family transcriptional regulator [Sphingobium sp.]|uniref:TetR family transcriptional regulator n=2 Tax=Sphingobium TaxID=165695 RepID=UPI00082BB523|nr:TetR family transcriptional regulator [Sphingobium sp.]MBJ7375886.1 TetR family transcriptional regulator [Sphingobium sp.]
MALTVDRIADQALALLDEVGLEGLSTRKLAAALGMQGPSLYHHFQNKAELLGHMTARILYRALAPLDRNVAWDVWLRTLSHATRAMTLEYRDGAMLYASSNPSDEIRRKLLPDMAEPLLRAGFTQLAADQSISFLGSFVVGWAVNEQNETVRRLMVSMMEMDETFAAGVETLVQGIAIRNGKSLSTPAG